MMMNTITTTTTIISSSLCCFRERNVSASTRPPINNNNSNNKLLLKSSSSSSSVCVEFEPSFGHYTEALEKKIIRNKNNKIKIKEENKVEKKKVEELELDDDKKGNGGGGDELKLLISGGGGEGLGDKNLQEESNYTRREGSYNFTLGDDQLNKGNYSRTSFVKERQRHEELRDRSFQVNDRGTTEGSKMFQWHKKVPVDTPQRIGRSNFSNKSVAKDKDDDVCDEEEVGFKRAGFKSLDEFEEDIVDKPRISRIEMEERIQKLARSLNGADISIPEWMFSKMMRSAKIKFSDHSILRIIQVLGKLGNWRRVLQLIDWLQSRERFKSHKLRHIYTTAIGELGKARRPVEALNLFHTMQQHMHTYPDLVAYRCIAVTLGRAGYMRELFEVMDIMKSHPKKKLKTGVLEKWDPRVDPDIVVFNAVLNACVQRKKWEGAFWVLQQLKEKGQQPSCTTYGLVMEVMLVCGKYNLVHDFFNKLLKSSTPNALTYKVLINTLWREGKTDEAVLAVRDMERRGIVGSASLYYDLARCLCSAGRCQEALAQIDKICKVADKPLVVTYTGLIQACLDVGNIEDGVIVFNHMHKFCSPNLVTYNIMLKAYIEHRKFEEAYGLFHKLLEKSNNVSGEADYKDRVIPDKYSFNTMLDACVSEERWDDFDVVYKKMSEYGYPLNAKRHQRMIQARKAPKGELLETTWKAGQIPPPMMMKETFCMQLEQAK